jgi:hypothetical protein
VSALHRNQTKQAHEQQKMALHIRCDVTARQDGRNTSNSWISKLIQLTISSFHFFFDLHKLHVNFIYTADVFGQYLPIGVLHYRGFAVPPLQVLHESVESSRA